MYRWLKTGICVLTMGAMLHLPALAAGLDLAFDEEGNRAAVTLTGVEPGRYAAEVTFTLTSLEEIQFTGSVEHFALTLRPDSGQVTLYVASQAALNPDSDAVSLGTLTVKAGTQVTGAGSGVVLDEGLVRTELGTLEITTTPGGSDEGSGDGSDSGSGGGSGSDSGSGGQNSGEEDDTPTYATPKVSVQGTGGKVRVERGQVTITPDAGYRIARILVNGQEVAVQTTLTGLKSSDRVEVWFEAETTAAAPQFDDVAADAWYADAVAFAAERGLFQGVGENRFAPEASMSRAMLVTVLYRMSGQSAPAGGSGFTDVPADAWYADAVSWAEANGIVQGMGEGVFAPDQDVSREQTAAILCRYSAYMGKAMPQGEPAFADRSEIGAYAVEAVGAVQAAGLMNGRDGNRFAPRAGITRAEVATLLMRYDQWSNP
ncbi:S-layer homology domain-containing protein [Flavonifractor hominis]|uniref:S-layer homology domain-containing protein n=1 Tax=Flavonifractor hominis TaxID=3133178 RepID=A0ABV1EPJ2_9FIRM